MHRQNFSYEKTYIKLSGKTSKFSAIEIYNYKYPY